MSLEELEITRAGIRIPAREIFDDLPELYEALRPTIYKHFNHIAGPELHLEAFAQKFSAWDMLARRPSSKTAPITKADLNQLQRIRGYVSSVSINKAHLKSIIMKYDGSLVSSSKEVLKDGAKILKYFDEANKAMEDLLVIRNEIEGGDKAQHDSILTQDDDSTPYQDDPTSTEND